MDLKENQSNDLSFKGKGQLVVEYHKYTEAYGKEIAAKLQTTLGGAFKKGIKQILIQNGHIDKNGNILGWIKRAVIKDGKGTFSEDFFKDKKVDFLFQKGGEIQKHLKFDSGTDVTLAGVHKGVTTNGQHIHIIGKNEVNTKPDAVISGRGIRARQAHLEGKYNASEFFNIEDGTLTTELNEVEIATPRIDVAKGLNVKLKKVSGDYTTVNIGNHTELNIKDFASRISDVNIGNDSKLRANKADGVSLKGDMSEVEVDSSIRNLEVFGNNTTTKAKTIGDIDIDSEASHTSIQASETIEGETFIGGKGTEINTPQINANITISPTADKTNINVENATSIRIYDGGKNTTITADNLNQSDVIIQSSAENSNVISKGSIDFVVDNGKNTHVEADKIRCATIEKSENAQVEAREIEKLEMHVDKPNTVVAGKINEIGILGNGAKVKVSDTVGKAYLAKGATLESSGDGILTVRSMRSEDGVLRGKMSLDDASLYASNAQGLTYMDAHFNTLTPNSTLPPTCNMTKRTVCSLPIGRKFRAMRTLGKCV